MQMRLELLSWGLSLRVACVCLISLLPQRGVAQNCDALLQHGVANIRRLESSAQSDASNFERYCGSSSNLERQQVATEAHASIFGNGGSVAVSVEGMRSAVQNWCNERRQTDARAAKVSQYTSELHDAALSSWRDCIAIQSDKLEYEPLISPGGERVSVSFRWRSGGSGFTVNDVEADGFRLLRVATPKGVSPAPLRFPISLTQDYVTFIFAREGTRKEVRAGETFEVRPRGVIQFSTNVKPVGLNFAEEWEPSLPSRRAEKLERAVESLQLAVVPVGTIMPYAGEPVGLGENWLLANGADVSRAKYPVLCERLGAAWGKATELTCVLPDLSGLFLRGIDKNGKVDPDKGRQLGSVQADSFKAHDHGLVRGAKAPEIGSLERHDLAVMAGSERLLRSSYDGNFSGNINNGGAETRPRNVAVYYIIRAK